MNEKMPGNTSPPSSHVAGKMPGTPSLSDHVAGKRSVLNAEMKKGNDLRQQEKDAQDAQDANVRMGATEESEPPNDADEPDADDMPMKSMK